MYPLSRQELRHRYSVAAWSLLAFTALLEGFSFLYALPYYLGNYDLYYNDWYQNLANCLIVYPAGFIAFGLILRKFPKHRLAELPAPGVTDIVQGIVVALGFLYTASYLTDFLLEDTNTVDYANEAVAEEPLHIAILFTVILAPLIEEILFRKLLLDRLLFLGDWSALVISSLFFGLFHTNLYQFLYATTVGLVLGYVHIMTGKMRWNVGLHMFINLFCGVLIGYLPDEDWVWEIFSLAVTFCIVFAVIYVIRKRPWREFYPGPMNWFTAEDKRLACLTSVPFWLCVALHLGLSVYYIIQ